MVRVRFLQSLYLISQDTVFNYNDETDMPKELAEELQKQDYVDILIEEKPVAPKSKAKKEKATEKTDDSIS